MRVRHVRHGRRGGSRSGGRASLRLVRLPPTGVRTYVPRGSTNRTRTPRNAPVRGTHGTARHGCGGAPYANMLCLRSGTCATSCSATCTAAQHNPLTLAPAAGEGGHRTTHVEPHVHTTDPGSTPRPQLRAPPRSACSPPRNLSVPCSHALAPIERAWSTAAIVLATGSPFTSPSAATPARAPPPLPARSATRPSSSAGRRGSCGP